MTENLNRPLQASDLAAKANVSLSHYFALFKRTTGYAPIDFFIRLRMKRARQLLETTSLNIKEIASALGYEDPFYFSRLFKSVAGTSPTDYRNAHQAGVGLTGGHAARSGSFLKAERQNAQQDGTVIARRASSGSSAEFFDIAQLSSTYL